jgi:beta-lactamase regulating signal transducer with metallopeptidase domain
MNSIGIALVWCVLQVTLVSLLTGLLYVIVRGLHPAASASVLFTGIGIIMILSFLAFSPQPRWKYFIEHSPDSILDKSPSLESKVSGASRAGNGQGTDSREMGSYRSVPHSRLGILWRIIDEEIFNFRPAGIKSGWRCPATVAALLFAAMALGWGWMILGLSAVRRQRLHGQAIADAELLEILDVLRAELGCPTPIELRQSDDLVTAATIGWRRPVILLPSEWKQWAPKQIRAVMAHEVAHVRNRDFLSLLIGQFALVLHFYHPLVHWLIRRLRLEQELAADAAAASVSGGRRQYLTTIAELALHQQDCSVQWPDRAFLPTKTTLLRRIAMLRDSKTTFSHISPAMRIVVVGAMLSCGLLAAGLREPGGQSTTQTNEVREVSTPSTVDLNGSNKQQQVRWDIIVEGVGWGNVRVGMAKEDLLRLMGPPDTGSTSNWLKWRQNYYIDCLLDAGAIRVSEIRFNAGFQGALANGLQIGSPMEQVIQSYGSKPDFITNRDNGAMKYEYSTKGLLFWAYQGRITQIVLFNPYRPN